MGGAGDLRGDGGCRPHAHPPALGGRPVIEVLLLCAAGAAFAAARRSAQRDRALNPPDPRPPGSPSVRLLSAVGRRPAVRLSGRISWLAQGWAPLRAAGSTGLDVDPAALRAGAGLAFGCLAV